MSNPTNYFGKYRGTVLNNIDPMQLGRLLVQVPDVLGVGTSSWAIACESAGCASETWSVSGVVVPLVTVSQVTTGFIARV